MLQKFVWKVSWVHYLIQRVLDYKLNHGWRSEEIWNINYFGNRRIMYWTSNWPKRWVIKKNVFIPSSPWCKYARGRIFVWYEQLRRWINFVTAKTVDLSAETVILPHLFHIEWKDVFKFHFILHFKYNDYNSHPLKQVLLSKVIIYIKLITIDKTAFMPRTYQCC